MRQKRFLLGWVFMVLITINCFSQNSVNDLNIVFKQNFENSTIGGYNYNEWYNDFLQPSWANRQSSLKIAQDLSSTVNPTKVMRIDYPANSTGPEEGGTNWWTLFEGQEELYMSYDFYFEPGFDFARAGKLFSFQAGEFSGTSVTGYDVATMGLMWNSEGNVVYYFYYPDSKVEEYGETVAWGYPSYPENYYKPSRISIKYSSKSYAKIIPGTWHNVTYRAVLNTVPTEGTGRFDGLMEGYLDGKLIIQLDSIQFRLTKNLKIDHIRMSTFFGGNRSTNGDTYWENSKYEWQQVDNLMLYTYKSDTVVPRGNVFSPTNRTVNYWRNFGNATPDPDPDPDPVIPTDTTLSADVVKVNFVRDEAIVASSDWNNLISRVNGATHNLKNEQGSSTPLSLYVNSANIYASAGGAFPGVYEDEVLKTGWRADNHATKSFQLKNLDTDKKYKFQILGSNKDEIVGNDPSGAYLNIYTVAGITKSACVLQNTENILSWVITPKTSTIDISWTGGSAYYGFINSLIISEADADEVEDVIVENATPQIQDQNINVSEVDYDAPIMGVVIASDPDQGQVLTYSIISGNESNLFSINQTNGTISTSSDDIFSYSQLNYNLGIKVEDNGQVKKNNQATITIHLVPDTKVVYIDPTNTNDLAENGSFEHPFNSWKDITWKNDYKYCQKRGTIASEAKISIYSTGITLGAYGEGNHPVILSSSKDYAIQSLDKESIAITNLHIIADDAISSIYLLGNENSNFYIQNCIIENSDYGVRVVEGKQITLKYNTFKNCIRAIYSFASENNVFYNIFKNNNNAVEIASLNSTTNVYNNVFYENGSGVSSSHGDLSLYNNIFYLINNGDVALNLKLDQFLSDNNIFFPEQDGFITMSDKSYSSLKDFSNDYQIDLNSFCKDPLFVDVYNDNFALSQGSPAINKGKFVGLSKDFLGIDVPYSGFPDIGVAEATFNNITTAIEKGSEEKEYFSVYPNPCQGQVNIEISKTNSTGNQASVIKVIDQTGKTVYSKEIGASDSDIFESIDLSENNNGIYYIMLESINKTITKKLMLLH